jgi:hypothetical protein
MMQSDHAASTLRGAATSVHDVAEVERQWEAFRRRTVKDAERTSIGEWHRALRTSEAQRLEREYEECLLEELAGARARNARQSRRLVAGIVTGWSGGGGVSGVRGGATPASPSRGPRSRPSFSASSAAPNGAPAAPLDAVAAPSALAGSFGRRPSDVSQSPLVAAELLDDDPAPLPPHSPTPTASDSRPRSPLQVLAPSTLARTSPRNASGSAHSSAPPTPLAPAISPAASGGTAGDGAQRRPSTPAGSTSTHPVDAVAAAAPQPRASRSGSIAVVGSEPATPKLLAVPGAAQRPRSGTISNSSVAAPSIALLPNDGGGAGVTIASPALRKAVRLIERRVRAFLVRKMEAEGDFERRRAAADAATDARLIGWRAQIWADTATLRAPRVQLAPAIVASIELGRRAAEAQLRARARSARVAAAAASPAASVPGLFDDAAAAVGVSPSNARWVHDHLLRSAERFEQRRRVTSPGALVRVRFSESRAARGGASAGAGAWNGA